MADQYPIYYYSYTPNGILDNAKISNQPIEPKPDVLRAFSFVDSLQEIM